MQSGSGFILIVVGLLLLYVVISGKLGLFEQFIYQLFGLQAPAAAASNSGVSGPSGVAPARSSLPYGLELPKLGGPYSIQDIFKP